MFQSSDEVDRNRQVQSRRVYTEKSLISATASIKQMSEPIEWISLDITLYYFTPVLGYYAWDILF